MAHVTKQINEDEIDNLKLPSAFKLAKDNGIDLKGNTKLDQIRQLLKLHLLCNDRKLESLVSSLTYSGTQDDKRRQALLDVYGNTLDNAVHISRMNDPIVEELNQLFPDFCKQLEDQQCHINHSKGPVMVLGETGAGKSSFINLLLGHEVLPSSLLSNTYLICEIRSSKASHSYAFVYPNGKDHDIIKIEEKGDDREGFKKELAERIQMMDKNTGQPIYTKAEVFLPYRILESGLVIVDSPGIGDTKGMDDLVLDYILEACTFIYIINSTSAGGVQARLQTLLRKVYEKALQEQRVYRPESAIFICNKWDQVPIQERGAVWKDTVKKLKNCWPECREDQIFCLSTKEAMFIQENGKVAPQWERVLSEINRLVPLGREILVYRGYRYLVRFVEKCIYCFETHLTNIRLSEEEREKRLKETKERLEVIKDDVDSFFEEQRKKLDGDISSIAKNLKTYLMKRSNLEQVCSVSEVPNTENWKDAAVEVRAKVYDKMVYMIQKWEEDAGEFKNIGKQIMSALEKQFPKFGEQIFAMEQDMSRPSHRSNLDEPEDTFSEPFMPDVIRDKLDGMNFGMKLALGIGLFPVTLVGMAVRLPVWGLKSLKRSIEKVWLENQYKDERDRKQVIETYAKNIVEAMVDRARLESIIKEDLGPVYQYLQQQRQRIEMQINSDMELWKKLREEMRNSDEVRNTYEPLGCLFKIQREWLRHFLVVHLPACREQEIELTPTNKKMYVEFHCLERDEHHDALCCGLTASIYRGKSFSQHRTGGFGDVALRRMTEPLKPQTVESFLNIEKAYSCVKDDNIIRCVAVTIFEGIPYQVLEPISCSLKEHLAQNEEYLFNNRRNCILNIMKDVMSGLKYLHDKRLVHLDLSQDTIAVTASRVVKLTNISPERKINLCTDLGLPLTTLQHAHHITPALLSLSTGKCRRASGISLDTQMIYGSRDDMYSVGVLMWELWTGRSICSVDIVYVRENDRFSPPEDVIYHQQSKVSDVSQTEEDLDADQLDHLQQTVPEKSSEFMKCSEDIEGQFVENWWNTIEKLCLQGSNITSKMWLAQWKDYKTYPMLSQVGQDTQDINIQENHFSSSP